MTKRQAERLARLLPGGVPKYIRVYDNAGLPDETIDNFTVVFTGNYARQTGGSHVFLSMNSSPFHPQGFGQHGEANHSIDCPNGKWAPAVGRVCHLGRRIRFESLPADCQKLVMRDYCELWSLPLPEVVEG